MITITITAIVTAILAVAYERRPGRYVYDASARYGAVVYFGSVCPTPFKFRCTAWLWGQVLFGSDGYVREV